VASPLTPEEEWNKRAWDEARERIRKFFIDRGAWDLEDYLAWQMGIHRQFLDNYIAGREEPSAVLRQQIAALLANLPTWRQRNETLLLAGVREPYPKFASADRVGARSGVNSVMAVGTNGHRN
jgi:hypothetical protein